MLTIKFVKKAITEVFPLDVNEIVNGLNKMLLYDAIVGNNDRHFFNWGIVRHIKNKHKPYFSPIYDTARGLFWNFSDENLLNLRNKKQIELKVVKYHNETKPKIGWDGEKKINHFHFVEKMLGNNDFNSESLKKVFYDENIEKVKFLLENEFKGLISDIRKETILSYLKYRFNAFNKVV